MAEGRFEFRGRLKGGTAVLVRAPQSLVTVFRSSRARLGNRLVTVVRALRVGRLDPPMSAAVRGLACLSRQWVRGRPGIWTLRALAVLGPTVVGRRLSVGSISANVLG